MFSFLVKETICQLSKLSYQKVIWEHLINYLNDQIKANKIMYLEGSEKYCAYIESTQQLVPIINVTILIIKKS